MGLSGPFIVEPVLFLALPNAFSPQLQDKLVVSMSTVSSVPAISSGLYSCMVWSWGGMGHSDLNAGFGN